MVNTLNYQQMPKVTFELSRELKKQMDEHPEVNWSAVFRQSAQRHIQRAEIARRIEEEANDPRVRAVAELLKDRVGKRWERALRARRR